MHILFTRPIENCSDMIIKFKLLGHKVSHLPLINIESVHYEKFNYSEFKGVIFTSANAVKYFDIKNIKKNTLCFCVGDATEKKARSSGFQNVIAAEGNVENLKELILQNFDKKNGNLLYVSGEIISSNLDQDLLKEGYNIKRIVNYKVNHNKKFDPYFIDTLRKNIPDIVYIYSQNTALSFLDFIKTNGLETVWMDTNLMCIGEKASSILNEIKWKKIFLFNPGEEEFLLYKI